MRIAIMQPYFFPYAGYFRLFAATDMFVLFDHVQFQRRGWIHRNQLLNQSKKLSWLTLPLNKCPQNTLIKDLSFSPNATIEWKTRLSIFPLIDSKSSSLPTAIKNTLTNIDNMPVVDYLENTLKATCNFLNIDCPIIRSSSLNISDKHRAQGAILEIAKQLKADEYLNAPGGKELYDKQVFDNNNIKLSFLPDFEGSKHSILQDLTEAAKESIRQKILNQSKEPLFI